MVSPLDADADAAGAPDRAPARPPDLRGVASSRGSCARMPWSPLARHSRAMGRKGDFAAAMPFPSRFVPFSCSAAASRLSARDETI